MIVRPSKAIVSHEGMRKKKEKRVDENLRTSTGESDPAGESKEAYGVEVSVQAPFSHKCLANGGPSDTHKIMDTE